MGDGLRGQVSRAAAEHYEQHFLPALFAQWPPRLAEAADVRPGNRVLDVACGTGVLARHLTERVGPAGSVVGLDLNDGMLAVAARQTPGIEWRQGRAEELPFQDASFNAVVSQFGLKFFEDRPAALREMRRVLRRGGRLAVAVWDRLENSPGYAALAGLLERMFGPSAAQALRTPFVLGDLRILRGLFSALKLRDLDIRTLPGQAQFPSTRAWMETEICGWVLRDVLDENDRRRLADESEVALARFAGPGGSVAFAAPALIASGVKP